MNAIDTLRNTAATSAVVLTKYVEDLSDQDLMARPAPGCNHLAWQLGHLISSECQLLDSVCPGAAPQLPEGFAEKHSKETGADDDPGHFCSKQEYLDLFAKVQAATSAALDGMTEADFDKPSPEAFQSMFPTVGHLFVLITMHPMMHAGQFVPVRRTLGKPVVI
ncbi:MAG: DinB family protein [Planctomycetales bacterium]|nr:DinB family protein [Planctomycetales bacterium]